MKHIIELLVQLLSSWGLPSNVATNLSITILFIGLTLLIYIIDFIIKRIIRAIFTKIANKSKTDFDDIMLANRVPSSIAQIIPFILTYKLIPSLFYDFEKLQAFSEKTILVVGIALTIWGFRNVLNSLKIYFKTLNFLKDKPVDSYIQVFMIFAWVIGVFSAIAILTGIAFINFITGLGAASAVVILIFKDTILGFVASIQVSINDMVHIGDWITFEKYGADGDVIEINLATVKVQNFDKTITTIPTYALISDYFKNWRGMVNSEGRRIKRALNIKLNTVKYLTKDEVDRLKKVQLITSYLDKRENDINSFNKNHNIDKELPLNGRNLTNLGVFRKYAQTYLEQHSAINKDMMIMVRQLAPTTQGIPLEVYAFSTDKRWENYEYIMSDIFDHLIAAVSYFDLEVYELPTGSNFNIK